MPPPRPPRRPVERVLLVSTNTVKAPYPVPPVGVCLLASSVGPGIEVRVHDGTFRGAEGLAGTVEAFRPDLVGLGIRNIDDVDMLTAGFFLDEIRDSFLRAVRESTDAPVILGGSGFSLFPRRMLEFFGAEYGIAGEGERSLLALIEALVDGREPGPIPGLVRSGGGSGHGSSALPPAPSLRIPRANIDRWIDWDPYRRLGAYPIQTKRGCGQMCLYCTYPGIEGPAVRLRPPAEVADEIEEAARRLPGTTFELVDSTFNDPPGHAEAICREIASRTCQVRLRTMGINPAGASASLISAMKDAGFAQIDCTPDSASPRMIASLRKNFVRDDLERAAREIRRHNMPTVWFFLFGGPGEDEETVRETLDFVDRFVSGDDLVLLNAGLRIYPGTGLHAAALRDGVIRHEDDLLRPRFYVSPRLGAERLVDLLTEAAATRPHCLPPGDSTPSPAMLREAAELRRRDGLVEPMFRTLLRIRRKWPRFSGLSR